MQIVINISEDVYTRLFDNGIQDNEIETDDICEMARAIRLGTPLPKGHGDLKDMDDIYEALEGWDDDTGWIVDAIDYQAPTIIEADNSEG